MRTLAHLSDLHFGRIDPAVLQPLRRRLAALAPDVVVVSGDLTQRARSHQFREARAFLDSLPGPQVVVPGNHDVPLYNVFQRFFRPLAKYRRHFAHELEPEYVDGEIAVIGINTARSFVFKGGRINEAQVERIRGRLCRLHEQVVKIVVTHHPFDMPPHWEDQHQVVGRAAMAMKALARCGADVLIAGHMHRSHAGETGDTLEAGGRSALLVGAGTATSTRGRGEANSFNLLRIDARRISVEEWAWHGAGEFEPGKRRSFRHCERGWVADGVGG